jgi:hypothetical protein
MDMDIDLDSLEAGDDMDDSLVASVITSDSTHVSPWMRRQAPV